MPLKILMPFNLQVIVNDFDWILPKGEGERKRTDERRSESHMFTKQHK